MILAGAKSAIHEIEAFLLFLIGAVFLVGAAIVDAIYSQSIRVTRYLDQMFQSQQRVEEHLRVLRRAYEEQSKHEEPLPPALTLDETATK